MVKKYVIAGGPCTGKTTMLKSLESEGFSVFFEVAREVLNEELTLNPDFRSWNDVDAFQKKVLARQIERELDVAALDVNYVFFDSGIPTAIPYFLIDNKTPLVEIVDAAKKYRYDKIFFLEKLPHYENDSERKEDADTAEKIHTLMKKVYEDLGYDLIIVPALGVAERVAFVKTHLNK